VLDAAALAAFAPLGAAAVVAAGGRRHPSVLLSRSGQAWRKRRHTAIRQALRTYRRSVTRQPKQ
jgi:hypothetical protein